MIPYGRQSISQEDIDAVVDVLRSDFLTQGPAVPAFEAALIEATGGRFSVAANSATSALHIACLALGVGDGDWVWTSPNTFVASANAARYCGASVDFVDVDPVSFNMDTAALAAKLELARTAGKLPKVVIPVHFAGQPCDMREIAELAAIYGFNVVEDASHAIGATYLDSKIGDCRYSDITVFSFHPVKIITTAEGGAAMTCSEDLAERMRLFRSHGITRNKAVFEEQSEGDWYYEQQCLGYNYRMTDLQAALGVSQISNLEAWISRRHEIADQYDSALSALPLVLPKRSNDRRSALHLYPIQIDPAKTNLSRRAVFDRLRAAGIHVNVHYIPVHLQPDFRDFGKRRGDFPAAETYYDRALSIPMYSGLSDGQLETVIEELKRALAS